MGSRGAPSAASVIGAAFWLSWECLRAGTWQAAMISAAVCLAAGLYAIGRGVDKAKKPATTTDNTG